MVALLVVTLLVVAARIRYPGKASTILQHEACDSDLWNHVYQKDRLQVMEECTAVDGRIVSLRRSRDGDLHIALDPDQKSALNLINLVHADGMLVVESVCDHVPDRAEEQAACENFHSHVSSPRVGDRVHVVGAYVTDRDNGWREIHPVTRIDVLH